METAATPLSVHHSFATIFSYPGDQIKSTTRQLSCTPGLSEVTSAHLTDFVETIEGMASWKLEESFTYTFDMNPSACLELGWHLFGESYERGEFLVKMRQSLKKYGIPETTELPDHISHCLQVLERLEEKEAMSFVQSYLFPALKKITESLPEDNVYRPAAQALNTYLIEKYPNNEEMK